MQENTLLLLFTALSFIDIQCIIVDSPDCTEEGTFFQNEVFSVSVLLPETGKAVISSYCAENS